MTTDPDDEQASPAPEPRPVTAGERRARSRTRRRWIAAGVVATVLILAVIGAASMVTARRRFFEGRGAMERGKERFLAGDLRQASSAFGDAAVDFSAAGRTLSNPVLRAIGWLPIAGRTPDALDRIADTGNVTALAASQLAHSIERIPGGLSGLAPAGGGFDLDRLEAMAAAVRTADDRITRAIAILRDAPDSLLLPPVGAARATASAELSSMGHTLHAASLVLDELPRLLGRSAPTRYFFGAQNPAELRGTGGLIGEYSILTIDDGRFSFRPFEPTSDLRNLPPASVPAPNEDYARNYDEFRGGQRFWSAINVIPDMPSAAQAILNGYEAVTGQRLDGVVLADPFALQSLLGITGPVGIPGTPFSIDERNVVSFTTNRAYRVFDNPDDRKHILGRAAELVFERFVARPSQSLSDLRTVADAVSQGHLLVYSDDAKAEEGLRELAIGGALRAGGGDFLSVIVNSAAGSKVDYFQSRDISYSVRLQSDGTARTTTDVSLTNHAPTSGQPRYVIGPFVPGSESGPVGPVLEHVQAGESVALVNAYCGIRCVPQRVTLNGSPTSAIAETDLGVPYVRAYFPVLSGATADLTVSGGSTLAWRGNGSGGTYRLMFANQVTVRPANLRVEVQAPPGMHVVGASDGMRIERGAAVYDGVPDRRLVLQVTFRPSLPVRLWRDVVRFLSRPVIRF